MDDSGIGAPEVVTDGKRVRPKTWQESVAAETPCLYVVSDGTACKLGKSVKFSSGGVNGGRMSVIQNGNPRVVTCILRLNVYEDAISRSLEKYLQASLKSFLVRPESSWYSLHIVDIMPGLAEAWLAERGHAYTWATQDAGG